MLHYREMGILLNSGNWVHIIKKVVYIAIYTYIIPSIFMYLKLTSVNWGRKDDKLNRRILFIQVLSDYVSRLLASFANIIKIQI